MPSGERMVRLSNPAPGELGVPDNEKEATSVRTIRATLRSLLPANFLGGRRGRESREPAPHMGRVSFVQTNLDRQLFPLGPLTNHLACSSHPRGNWE